MDAEWDDKVRARAYALWEREERPEGGAEEALRAEERGRTEETDAEAATVEAAGTAAVHQAFKRPLPPR